MSTTIDRTKQAHRHAVALANAAYAQAGPGNEAKSDAYYKTYQREMTAYYHLEEMRKPLTRQKEIDADSADLLRITCDTDYTLDA